MLKLIGRMLKFSLFAIAVLLVGNYAKWRGQTISDHVQTSFSRAEDYTASTGGVVVSRVHHWARGLANDARDGARAAAFHAPARHKGAARAVAVATRRQEVATEARDDANSEIPATERQKLRDLIHELNRSF